MILPNCDNAIIKIEKLTEYCLNKYHPIGKHKAKVFQSVLNITLDLAFELKEQILSKICLFNAIESDSDKYGIRYFVDINLINNNLTAIVRTSWIIKTNKENPILTSCYVLK